MPEPLQQFGWKKSTYERPTNKWVCGELCNGTPCQLGPTSQGACQEKNETGSDASSPRCRPKRSLHQKRRIATVSGVALSLSVCLLLLNSNSPGVLSPGPLTSHHSSTTMSCSDCHSSAAHDWTQTVFQTNSSIEDSMLCMKCHQDLGQEPFLAHSLKLETLEELMAGQFQTPASFRSLTMTASSFLVNREPNTKRSCNVCHQEHHGRLHDLNKFTNQQCQSCHSEQFHSFEQGHPEFISTYGNEVDGIHFDHAAHLSRYFLDDAQRLMPNATPPADCAACHQASTDGRRMLTRGFDQMCASCHEQGIQDQDFPGVPFFALPEIQSDKIGEWPAVVTGQSLKKSPGYMELLLPPSTKEIPATDVAWAIKEFFWEVSNKGQRAIRERLPQKWSQLENLEPSIVPVLLHAQQLWFPHLEQELLLRKQGQPFDIQKKVQTSSVTSPLESEIGGGWSIRPDDHTIRYRPIGHADPVIKLLLEESLKNWRQGKDEQADEVVLELLEQLMNPSASGTLATQGAIASGRCLSCHGVEKDSLSKEWTISWSSNASKKAAFSLTRFIHGPHLKNGFEDQCLSCHQLDEERTQNAASLRTAFDRVLQEKGNEQTAFSHGLVAISKASCAECHNQQSQLDNCTQCHQYHAMQQKH